MTQETDGGGTSIGASPARIANPEPRHEANRAIMRAPERRPARQGNEKASREGVELGA